MTVLAVASDPREVMRVADAIPATPIRYAAPQELTAEEWGEAGLVLLLDGTWHDERVRALPARPNIWLVGAAVPPEHERGERGYALPGEAEMFADAVHRVLAGHPPDRCLLTVVGAAGGLGASSLSAAIALHAALRGLRAMLIDLDPFGGGSVRHFTGRRHTPEAMAYLLSAADPRELTPARLAAGIRAATADCDVAVMDCPRHLPTAPTVIAGSDRVLLLAPDAPLLQPGLAAAAEFVRGLNPFTELVVRTNSRPGLGAAQIEAGLGIKAAARLGHDQDAARPEPALPGQDPFSALAHTARNVLERYLGPGPTGW